MISLAYDADQEQNEKNYRALVRRFGPRVYFNQETPNNRLAFNVHFAIKDANAERMLVNAEWFELRDGEYHLAYRSTAPVAVGAFDEHNVPHSFQMAERVGQVPPQHPVDVLLGRAKQTTDVTDAAVLRELREDLLWAFIRNRNNIGKIRMALHGLRSTDATFADCTNSDKSPRAASSRRDSVVQLAGRR